MYACTRACRVARDGLRKPRRACPPGSRPTLPAENGCSCALWARAAAIASILTAANEKPSRFGASEVVACTHGKLRSHCTPRCTAGAASPATSGPRVERISPHTLVRPSRAPNHCSLASASAIPHCVPQQSERPDQPGSSFILLSKDSHRGSRRGGSARQV